MLIFKLVAWVRTVRGCYGGPISAQKGTQSP